MTCLSGIITQDQWCYIETGSLAELLKTGLDKVLLIDSRSFLEYNTSRIQQSVNVCCSKLAKRRLQQDKITVKDLLAQLCHIDLEEYSDIVVYDQCTTDICNLTDDNFLVILLKKLKSNQAIYKVALLRGGYLAFQAMQPHLCESKSDNNYKCTALTFLSQPCLPVSNVGPTRILPFLYLGSHRDAMSQETIQVNDISYILNVSTTCPKPPFVQEGHFFRIPINDNYSAKMLPFFEEAFQFIDKVREANGCVLVHCLAGISRSPTLAIAYIMKHLNMSSDDAYRYVKDKRPTISPNFNFLGQLLEYEKQMKHTKDINKQDGATQDNKPKSIIAMDLQMCSPSSPKISKSFTFDALWDSYSVSGNSDDSCKTLPLLRDNDTWADFAPMDISQDELNPLSDMISKSNEENNNVKRRTNAIIDNLKESQYWPGTSCLASTPCEETKSFPFTIPSETSNPQKLSSSPKSQSRLSLSPKSPGKRTFSLPLSSMPMSETKEKSFSCISESVSYERVRLKSPRQSFGRPFTLPLSPVISPAEENLSDNSPSTSLPYSSAIAGHTRSSSVTSTPVSRRSFSLALSSCVGSVKVDKDIDSGSQVHRMISLTSKSPTATSSSNSHENVSRLDNKTSSSIHSCEISTCVHKFNSSVLCPPQKTAEEGQRDQLSCSGTPSEIKGKILSPNESFKCTKQAFVKDTRPSELKIPLSSVEYNFSSPNKRPSFSLALSTVISTNHLSSPSKTTNVSPLSEQNIGKTNETPSNCKSSHLKNDTVQSVKTIKQEFKPLVPNSLAIQNSVIPNKKLCISQKMSPSSAMARLNFSQTLSDSRPVEQSNLQNYPSTTLEKLNFTPCFANSSSKLTRKKFTNTVTCDTHSLKEETMLVSPTETISPVSSSGSSSSGTITSPTSTSKVVRRSHDNRAKRPMERPNSIAFSKYPTFDLGSDCQDSPSSGSSTSQDDASDMYILQNGKRSKQSDTKLRIGHYSEKEVYKQISAAMESAMLRTKVYEANRKARSLDDILTSEDTNSPNRMSPFNRLPAHCMLGNDHFSSAIYEGCRTSSDPYHSNSSISSSGSHNSLQGSLEIIQVS